MNLPNPTVLRWAARLVATLVLLEIAAFAIGVGVPNPLHGSLRENLLSLALLTMISGLVAGWKWEGIGGLLIVGGFAVFSVVNGRVSLNVIMGPMLLAGLLYLACRWQRPNNKRGVMESSSRPG